MENTSWHLKKGVSLSVIITLAVTLGSFIVTATTAKADIKALQAGCARTTTVELIEYRLHEAEITNVALLEKMETLITAVAVINSRLKEDTI